jgi:hypothetical protein
MKSQQTLSHGSELKTDYLAWRVTNAKKRRTQTQRNRVYNMRPRLRSDAHH